MNEQIRDVAQAVIDSYRGDLQKYSVKQTTELLRDALVEMNGGSTKMDYKRIRDGKCNGMFALMEEILDNTVVEGITNNSFFMNMVEFRDTNLGDQPVFEIEDSDLFTVAQSAEGTLGIRRQRLSGISEQTIPTRLYFVRIYEEMNRIMANRVDLNKMINKVGQSFEQKLLNDLYSLWSSVTATDLGGTAYFPVVAPYDEGTLLETIEHVEAAAGGKSATIIGTKAALRNLVPSIMSHPAEDDVYNFGYVGKFFGNNVIALPQRHQVGSTNFVFPNNTLTIVAGDDKPVKCVREGSTFIMPVDALHNADLTSEYYMAQRWGMGLITTANHGLGIYQLP